MSLDTIVRQQLPVFMEFPGIRTNDKGELVGRSMFYVNAAHICAFYPATIDHLPDASVIATVDGETYLIDTSYQDLQKRMQELYDYAFKGKALP